MERMPSAFTAPPQIRIYATAATRQPRSPEVWWPLAHPQECVSDSAARWQRAHEPFSHGG